MEVSGLGLKIQPRKLKLQTQLFNFWGSQEVVDSESFNFYFVGFWASELKERLRELLKEALRGFLQQP